MPSQALQDYLRAVQSEYASNQATEHSYRPALKALLERIGPGVAAINEPQRIACGAPDYALTRPSGHGPLSVGYVEAKNVGHLIPDIERTDQLQRYLRALPNVVLTDYLEFRWYVDGALRQTAKLAAPGPGHTIVRTPQADHVEELLRNFIDHPPELIRTPEALALRMARLTHIIRDIIVEAFNTDRASTLLRGWRKAFADVLIADLEQPEKAGEFADMFAQTLAYGLFSARVMDTTPADFSRQEAQRLIPRTNPFLREFFADISGIRLDDEPFVGFVDDLAALLSYTDMRAVLADFGKRTRQEDPVVHFYETFLSAYDPKLRESRGVYYTPEPVVSYIVRSVDSLLMTQFGLREVLADTSKVRVANTDPSLKVKGTNEARKTMESHRVLILDPATGTATFPYAVIDHIRERFMERGNAGMWSTYVRDHLLPRLFGFELLVAPYAVAHFKLGLQLAGRDLPSEERAAWTYDFSTNERLGIYLTNTLDAPHEFTGLPLFTQFVADETNAANRVKRDLPIMIVMGNPPYSGHSANKGEWIRELLRGRDTQSGRTTASYFEVDGRPLGERNPKWLNDDYVKFIRFAQWRIDGSGAGILAFISNNGYLDNPTFRGMRQALMQTFTDIYILDLHGNANKQERAPGGGPDENVFDIKQGVAIGIFVKQPGREGPAMVHHADLWGIREDKEKRNGKYPWLFGHDVSSTEWKELAPQSPYYLFVPQTSDLLAEYQQGWRVSDIFPLTLLGPNSHRDHFAIAFEPEEALVRLRDFADTNLSDNTICERYGLRDNRDWSLSKARKRIPDGTRPVGCIYRPFDFRSMLYGAYAFDYHRPEVNDHLLAPNLALISTRQTKEPFAVLVTDRPAGQHKLVTPYDGSYLSPLYRYPGGQQLLFDSDGHAGKAQGRQPNLNPDFVADIEHKLGLGFTPDGTGDLEVTFGPEDIFHYLYAVLHSQGYRARYAEFLRMDFPRIPITSDRHVFRELCRLGRQLVGLHTMKSHISAIAAYPRTGSNRVEKVDYMKPDGVHPGRVLINKAQYFEGVRPDVWGFQVGGYRPAQRWLKDRKGRTLMYDDLNHYMSMVSVLAETMRLVREIDVAIPAWPIGLTSEVVGPALASAAEL